MKKISEKSLKSIIHREHIDMVDNRALLWQSDILAATTTRFMTVIAALVVRIRVQFCVIYSTVMVDTSWSGKKNIFVFLPWAPGRWGERRPQRTRGARSRGRRRRPARRGGGGARRWGGRRGRSGGPPWTGSRPRSRTRSPSDLAQAPRQPRQFPRVAERRES